MMTQEEIQQVVAALEKKYVLIPKKRSIEAFKKNDEIKSLVINDAVNVCLNYFGVTISTIDRRNKIDDTWTSPHIRGVITLVLRNGLGLNASYAELGDIFGKNHATMLHNMRIVANLMTIDYSRHRNPLYQKAGNPWKNDYLKLLDLVKKRVEELLLVE